MKTIKTNNVLFKGQFAKALEDMQKGYNITLNNFNNGTWEPTSKVAHFLYLLNKAGIDYNKAGISLRQTVLSI